MWGPGGGHLAPRVARLGGPRAPQIVSVALGGPLGLDGWKWFEIVWKKQIVIFIQKIDFSFFRCYKLDIPTPHAFWFLWKKCWIMFFHEKMQKSEKWKNAKLPPRLIFRKNYKIESFSKKMAPRRVRWPATGLWYPEGAINKNGPQEVMPTGYRHV